MIEPLQRKDFFGHSNSEQNWLVANMQAVMDKTDELIAAHNELEAVKISFGAFTWGNYDPIRVIDDHIAELRAIKEG